MLLPQLGFDVFLLLIIYFLSEIEDRCLKTNISAVFSLHDFIMNGRKIQTNFGFSMGNEEAAGEILPPCHQNLNGIRRKRKGMHTFYGSPYFFKVMVGDFAQKLCIPPAFAQTIRSEIGKGLNGVLQGPRGMRWDVKLCITGTRIEFSGAGWEIFVYQHAIEFGDFLVFKYIGGMCFRVRIFGKNGCEKYIPNFQSEKIQSDFESQRKCPDPSTSAVPTSSDQSMKRKLSVELKRKSTADDDNQVKKPKLSSQTHSFESPEHFHTSFNEKEQQTVNSVKPTTEKWGRNILSQYVSCRRPVNATKKKEALEAAKSFVSENPIGLLIMKPSMVYQLFRLATPNAFIDNLKLPRERTEVTLVDPLKREWAVQFLGDFLAASMVGGWRYFSVANNLEEGDACIFERVDDSKNKIKLNVHIFRVVKECSLYKHINKGEWTDSLPFITNKKTQVSCDDFSTNLPAKAFGPEKGKCVKQGIEQMQSKKKKPSNGSKYINLDKSKCKTSISERKASCRFSLRLVQACHLTKCPKKELWEDRNVVILS